LSYCFVEPNIPTYLNTPSTNVGPAATAATAQQQPSAPAPSTTNAAQPTQKVITIEEGKARAKKKDEERVRDENWRQIKATIMKYVPYSTKAKWELANLGLDLDEWKATQATIGLFDLAWEHSLGKVLPNDFVGVPVFRGVLLYTFFIVPAFWVCFYVFNLAQYYVCDESMTTALCDHVRFYRVLFAIVLGFSAKVFFFLTKGLLILAAKSGITID